MKTYILLDNDGVTNAFGQMQYLKGEKSSQMTELNPDNWFRQAPVPELVYGPVSKIGVYGFESHQGYKTKEED